MILHAVVPVYQNMEGVGAYGGGKAGGTFDPLGFAQKPQVIVRAVSWVCLYNDDTNACNYGVGISVIAFLATMGFLVGEYLFEQMSSVKSRKHYVLIDLGFSAFWSFLYFVCFWYLTSQWGKSKTPPQGVGVSNVRPPLRFRFSLYSPGYFFCERHFIDFKAVTAFFAFQRFRQGSDAAFATNYEADANMGGSYPSYPGGPDTDQHYQEPPFSAGPNQRGPADFQAPAY
ncbi:hypothetical protein NQ317_008636 [Molorchus minor]|uniref:MARVEL domain-containing protein n=1 Tax=Molorchus minor TaxID=1323400 RepID=A0ABQ9K255_9CUCU|nr:hypothetical protein NQ317_008636 [Molorchus minor]